MNPYIRRKPWLIPIFIVTFIVVASFAVMMLWNNILPKVVPGLGMLSYWQATGLLILCRILFGGFHKGGSHRRGEWDDKAGGHGGGPWNGGPPWGRNWRNMSEEERLKFREEWKKRRCGPWGPSNEETKNEE